LTTHPLPNDYKTVAEAFELHAAPYGHASVDIGSDVNARWRDSDVLDVPIFGIRIRDEYFVMLSVDGSVAVRIYASQPPRLVIRAQRFMPDGVVVTAEGVTDRQGTHTTFNGEWVHLSPSGTLQPSLRSRQGLKPTSTHETRGDSHLPIKRDSRPRHPVRPIGPE
jgi:hypothetical protein